LHSKVAARIGKAEFFAPEYGFRHQDGHRR
jgi:hypothetical protein